MHSENYCALKPFIIVYFILLTPLYISIDNNYLSDLIKPYIWELFLPNQQLCLYITK